MNVEVFAPDRKEVFAPNRKEVLVSRPKEVIDEIIFQLDNLSTKDLNENWNFLVANYSKLKYLERMESELNENINLINSLRKFMEQIDKVSQHYLKEIIWDFSHLYLKIKNKLIESINHNNPLIKLRYVIQAYDILVPIVEEIREQKYVEQIEDKEFIQTFKKRRIN